MSAKIGRKIVFSTALTMASFGVALLVSELLLRIIRPSMAYPYMPQTITMSHLRPGTMLPLELKPDNRSRFRMLEFDTTVVTNSRGFRDAEVNFRVPRVLCVGDSYTFGFGVENDEAFCSLLEQLFRGRYDFVNVGYADGYSPDTYALWLSKHVDELAPAAILVTFFQNDYADVIDDTWLRDGREMVESDEGLPDRITREGYVVTSDGGWGRDNMVMHWPPVLRRLVKKSYLVGFVRDRLLHDIDRGVGPRASGQINGTDSLQAPDEKFVRALDMLRDAAEGTRLVFYIIPARDQGAPSRLDGLIREFAERNSIPVLFNGQEFSSDDTFTFETHWNASGHAKAARYLRASLVKLGL